MVVMVGLEPPTHDVVHHQANYKPNTVSRMPRLIPLSFSPISARVAGQTYSGVSRDSSANDRLGSAAEVQALYSLAAASERKPVPKTRNFNFPELTSAYEGEADY